MSELHVFRTSAEWLIAKSADEARQALMDHFGYDPEDLEFSDFEQCPDEELLAIQCNPDGSIAECGYGENELVERTMADWAQRIGPGFLCTTEC